MKKKNKRILSSILSLLICASIIITSCPTTIYADVNISSEENAEIVPTNTDSEIVSTEIITEEASTTEITEEISTEVVTESTEQIIEENTTEIVVDTTSEVSTTETDTSEEITTESTTTEVTTDEITTESTEESTEVVEEKETDEKDEDIEYIVFDHIYNDVDVSSIKTKDLFVSTKDATVFTKNTNVVSNFDNVYIISCASVEEAQFTYSYYVDKVEFISDLQDTMTLSTNLDDIIEELDNEETTTIETKDEQDTADLSNVNEDNSDAIACINDIKVNDYTGYIALIDSGVNADIPKLSVVNGSTEDVVGHGTNMYNYIIEENSDAKVLSIKAFDNNTANAADIYAAIQLAIESNVSVINLSFTGMNCEQNQPVIDAINEAINKGITVIGAAGNFKSSASGFVPGCIPNVITVGAVNEDQTLYKTSNYDADKYVIATSTSEATARFSGIFTSNNESTKVFDTFLSDSTTNDKDTTDKNAEEFVDNNIEEATVFETNSVFTVKYLYVDPELIDENETIDSLYETEKYDAIIDQAIDYPTLYNQGDTFMFYADMPWKNGLATGEVLDYEFAKANYNGEVIDEHASFDTKTKVAYIDKSMLEYNESMDSIGQLQIMVPVKNDSKVSVDVFVYNKFDKLINQSTTQFDLFDEVALQFNDGIRSDDILDFKINDKSYDYIVEENHVIPNPILMASNINQISIKLNTDDSFILAVAVENIGSWSSGTNYKNDKIITITERKDGKLLTALPTSLDKKGESITGTVRVFSNISGLTDAMKEALTNDPGCFSNKVNDYDPIFSVGNNAVQWALQVGYTDSNTSSISMVTTKDGKANTDKFSKSTTKRRTIALTCLHASKPVTTSMDTSGRFYTTANFKVLKTWSKKSSQKSTVTNSDGSVTTYKDKYTLIRVITNEAISGTDGGTVNQAGLGYFRIRATVGTTTPPVLKLGLYKRDALTATPIPGALYNIYDASDNNKLIAQKTTDANGGIYINSGLTSGHTYFALEQSAPAGYVVDTNPIYLTLKADLDDNTEDWDIATNGVASDEPNVHNEPRSVYYAKIKKVNEKGQAVPGVNFYINSNGLNVTDINGYALPNNTITTDANGEAVLRFNDVPTTSVIGGTNNNYIASVSVTATEVEPNAAYAEATKLWNYTPDSGFTYPNRYAYININTVYENYNTAYAYGYTFNNTWNPTTYYAKVRKVDQNGNGVPGIKFQISTNPSKGNYYVTDVNGNAYPNNTVTTGSDGTALVRVNNVHPNLISNRQTPGNFIANAPLTFTEVQPDASATQAMQLWNYTPDESNYPNRGKTITVDYVYENSNTASTSTITMNNEWNPTNYYVKVKKVDHNGLAVPGVKLKISTNTAKGKYYVTYPNGDTLPNNTITTGSDGTATVMVKNVHPSLITNSSSSGNFIANAPLTFTEVKPDASATKAMTLWNYTPDGITYPNQYKTLDTETVYENSNTATTNTYTLKNDLTTKAQLLKKSSNTTCTDNNENYDLAGAEYKVFTSNDDADYAFQYKDYSSAIGTFKTNSDGSSNIIDITNYFQPNANSMDLYLLETKAPVRGYKLNTTIISVQANVGTLNTFEVTDDPLDDPLYISIVKKDQFGVIDESFKDISFNIDFYNAPMYKTILSKEELVNNYTPDATYSKKNVKLDANGKLQVDDNYPRGYVVISEINCPAHFNTKDIKMTIKDANGQLQDISKDMCFVTDAVLNANNAVIMNTYYPNGSTTYQDMLSNGIVVSSNTNPSFSPVLTVEVTNKNIRGDIELYKVNTDNEPMEGVKFSITNEVTGEKHYIYTDETGHATTKVSNKGYGNNVNYYDNVTDYDKNVKSDASVWFSQKIDSTSVSLDDWTSDDSIPGALWGSNRIDNDITSDEFRIGNYIIKEERCEANKGYQLMKPITVHINGPDDNGNNHLLNVSDPDALADNNKIWNPKFPAMGTKASVLETNATTTDQHQTLAQSGSSVDATNQTIRDILKYERLRAESTKYTVLTELMIVDKDDNVKLYMKDGKAYRKLTTFTTPDAYNKTPYEITNELSIELPGIDPTGLEENQDKLVVYETLFLGHYNSLESLDAAIENNTIKTRYPEFNEDDLMDMFPMEHKDKDDLYQTVRPVDIHTNIVNNDYNDRIANNEMLSITDRVYYTGLTIGKEYIVNGKLIVTDDSATVTAVYDPKNPNADSDGFVYNKTITDEDTISAKVLVDENNNPIVSKAKFTATSNHGYVDLVFNLDASLLDGKSVVAFEELSYNNKIIAVHADLEDEDQTIHIPSISTTTYNANIDLDEAIKELEESDNNESNDTDTNTDNDNDNDNDDNNLNDDTTNDTSDNDDANNDSDDDANSTDDSDKDSINDESNYDALAVIKQVEATKDNSAFYDRVTYNNLLANREYIIKGVLVSKDTKLPIKDANDKDIATQIKFTTTSVDANNLTTSPNANNITFNDTILDLSADHANYSTSGYIDVKFDEFDFSNLANKTGVVFEELYLVDGDNEYLVASHKDINDLTQFIYFMEVATTATDLTSDDKIIPYEADTIIQDKVSYSNLIPNREYTVKASLRVKNDLSGKYKDGDVVLDDEKNPIEVVTKFKPKKSNGYVLVDIPINTSYITSSELVVYESIYNKYGVKIATHNDINDTHQTVYIPEIGTVTYNAEIDLNKVDIDSLTQTEASVTKQVKADINKAFYDRINYNNLLPDSEYLIKGTLVNQKSGDVLKDAKGNDIYTETTFKTDSSSADTVISGFTDLKFEGFDFSNLVNTTGVVFEEVYLIKDDTEILIATHKDINDENQFIYFVDIATTATDLYTGEKLTQFNELTTINDTVSFTNLVPNEEYTLKAELRVKNDKNNIYQNGDPLLDENGNHIIVETTFIPNDYDGTVDVHIPVNTTNINSMQLVVYETLYNKYGVEIANHCDIDDANQTVTVPHCLTTASITNFDDLKHLTIVDTISYYNLIPDKLYVAKGYLVDKSTGEMALNAKGKPITAEQQFIPTTPDSTIDVNFEFSAEDLSGTFVVFEEIYIVATDHTTKLPTHVLVTEHKDINDLNQTVDINLYLQIKVAKADNDDIKYYLKGAEITLFNCENDEIVTDVNGNPCIATTDKNGQVKFDVHYGDYYVKETKAPNGYYISDKEYKVKPVLVDREDIVTETIKLSVLDEAIIIPPTPPYPPITGDNFPIFIFLIILIIGVSGTIYYLCSKKVKH